MSPVSTSPSTGTVRERVLLVCGVGCLAAGVASLEWIAAVFWGDLEVPERRILLRILSATGLGLGAGLILLRRWLAAHLVPLLAGSLALAAAGALVVVADLFMSYRGLVHQVRGGGQGERSGGLHVPDAELGWLPRSGAVERHTLERSFDVEYRIDAEGFREVPHGEAVARRLWLFGDSFTFGTSVSGEDSFANRLARDYLGDHVRVINAGVSGYGPVQIYGRLLRLRDRLQPGDVVVFALISEDLQRNVHDFVYVSHLLFRSGAEGEQRFPSYVDGKLESVRIDGFWNRLRGLLFHAPLTEDLSRFLHRAITGSAWRSIVEAHALLDDTRQLCEERGADFLLVFLPRANELLRNRYRVDVSSFDYADIRRFFPEDEAELRGLRFPDDFHWTPRGHEIGAEALVSVLLERGLLTRGDLRREVTMSSLAPATAPAP